MLNVLIIGKYMDSVGRLQKILSQKQKDIKVVGISQDDKSAFESIDRLGPDIVAMAMDAGDAELIQLAAKIYVYKPKIITVVYGDSLDGAVLRRLIDSGVRYAGRYPQDAGEFIESVQRLITIESERAEYNSQQHTTLLTSSTTVGFYSPKSGNGTTTCAVNTAVALAKQGRRTVILDLDLEFGDVASYLGLQPKKSIADLCSECVKDDLSITDIETYADVHSSGLYVISAPSSPEYAEQVTAEKLKKIMATLRIYFEYIIFDLPSGLSAKHAELFKLVNRIYLITPMQLNCVSATKKAINVIGVFGKKDSINVIVNRHVRTDMISVKDLHKILNVRIVLVLPSDYKAAVSANNTGVPIITGFPRNPVSHALQNLAIYTDSKNTDLDIWDMSQRDITAAYLKLSKTNRLEDTNNDRKAKKEKKQKKSLFGKKGE